MVNTEIIEGFKCYAPALAHINTGFSGEEFDRLYKLEERSFWFRSRNNLIRHFFESSFGNKKADICEIGCGTGFVLKGLTSLHNLSLSGSEIHVAGLKYAKKRLPNVELFQADATELPFKERYDAIGAFDVLEHIEEDVKAMKSIHNAIKPGGYFFVTVPQYQWMWSVEDDIGFHKRRYNRRELKEKLEESGFRVKFISSFVFTLFPAISLQRILGKVKKRTAADAIEGHQLPSVLNNLFYFLTQIDVLAIKSRLSLPWGGSLVCVAKKENE